MGATGIELAKAYVQIMPSADGIKSNIESLLGDGDATGKSFGSKIAGGIGTGLKASAVAIGAGLAAATAGVTALAKESFGLYADYQQLTGGVETLFKDSGDVVKRYAANAFETAGLSANDYMETVTGFSASLIASLGGDTEKAAGMAHMAVVDMSDNANKMGSSMESIQNAYQGFAKQNYTMLDNLKLGYGGTKEEMQRLLEDAEKISGVKYDISSYADVVSAIHVMQESMDIAGTTSEEARKTISGSINMMKGSWANLLTSFGTGETELISDNINDLIWSVETAAENIIPAISTILPNLINSLSAVLTELLPYVTDLVMELYPVITSAASDLLMEIIAALPEILSALSSVLPTVVDTIMEALPMLIEAGMQVILELANGIAESLPTLIPTIVDVVLNIVDTLIDNVDMLIDGAIALTLGLAEGLINAMPKLIERIPEIVVKIVTALIMNAPKLVEASIKLILALAEGLVKNTSQLLLAIPQIVLKAKNAFIENKEKFIEAGKNMILGIKEGLVNTWHEIVDWIRSKAGELIDTVKSFFGIHSPSTVFRDQIGKNMALGLGEGYVDTMEDVNKQIESSLKTDFEVAPTVTASQSMIIDADVRDNGDSAIIGKLEQLIQLLSNQNIVLDTGALVGGTAPAMNAALGRLSLRSAI